MLRSDGNHEGKWVGLHIVQLQGMSFTEWGCGWHPQGSEGEADSTAEPSPSFTFVSSQPLTDISPFPAVDW